VLVEGVPLLFDLEGPTDALSERIAVIGERVDEEGFRQGLLQLPNEDCDLLL